MATKKDMRRADLVVPYVDPASKKDGDMASALSSTLPMAAVSEAGRDPILSYKVSANTMNRCLREAGAFLFPIPGPSLILGTVGLFLDGGT
ncbi:hypothetical protein D8B26_005243 [Coccidioides posadasii str. Silveira]|uniref:uncharacterized protein n=1 Tax=Coccidioides posadasii (strain RMSCC 757 / Silveira) TaxID=443226 RepID=UPI001BF0C720|nr:hypothetical protein D8B26_005243 [Coccidioides posadasii str. Silveira]